MRLPLISGLVATLLSIAAPTLAQPDASPAADAATPVDAASASPDASPTVAAAPKPAGSSAEDPSCPPGNLLAGRKPSSTGAIRFASRAVDGAVHRDGSPWNGKRSTIMSGPEAQITWDLGQVTTIRALLVQADNNDSYRITGSVDGVEFSPVWVVPEHPKRGLRTRLQQGIESRLRYLRIDQPKGDDAYSLGEVQAWCAQPALWPPALDVHDAPKTKKKKGTSRKRRLAWYKLSVGALGGLAFLALIGGRRLPRPRWIAVGGTIAALGVAIGGAIREHGTVGDVWPILAIGVTGALLAWLVRLRSRAGDEGIGASALERALLVGLLFAAGFSWINYGTFHGSRAIHYWDTYHYYMGGKYFPENRYHLIYQCSAIAEVDDGRKHTFANRQIRDLRDNSLGPAAPHVERDEACRAMFSPERWAEFRQEARLFRSYMGNSWWAKMFKDHGFNASPVWIMAGRTIAGVGGPDLPDAAMVNSPANLKGRTTADRKVVKARFTADRAAFETRIGVLVSIDLLLYAGCFFMIWWAFGLRACVLALLVWGAGYPWAYFWTGGSFGRVPWLFMSVAGMCLMGRGYRALGGAGITWAMLLRVFPGALIGGVSAKIAWNVIRHRTISPGHRRLIMGCTLGLVVLVGASLPVVGGFDAYREFIGNSFKHKSTPLTNHMGLPTILSYHPAHVARRTRNNDLDDPFAVWKQKRQQTLESRRILHYALLAAFLLLLGYVGRRLADWQLTALSTVLIVGIFELTCYYYCFVIMLAPLAVARFRHALALLAMTVGTQVGQMMRGWYDEQYTLESAIVLSVMLYILLDLALEHRRLDRQGEAPPDPDAPDPLPDRHTPTIDAVT